MPKRRMGSHKGLTLEQTSLLLGVSKPTILKLEADGSLRTDNGLYREDDVHELDLARHTKTKSNYTLALQAIAIARRAERQLEEIRDYLGLATYNLGVEKEDVIQFYEEARQSNLQVLLAQPFQVWSKKLLAIDEDYLSLVTNYTEDKEPWLVFMQLAQTLYRLADTTEVRARIDFARRSLRNVAYFCARRTLGKRAANVQFNDGSFTDRLMNHVIAVRGTKGSHARRQRGRTPESGQ